MARIAVVEDNKHLRDLLQTLLRLKKYEVEVFPDGAAALQAIDERFDLVLSDVQMPRLDGIELCRSLRKRWAKTDLPIIMISVLDGEDDILRALEAGANDYLVKPFSPSLVKAKVAYHLRRAAPPPTPRAPATPPRWDASLRPEPRRFPVLFDRYVLQGVLGRGSYGVVYDAQRSTDSLRVALKVLDESVSQDREMLARYFREIGSLSTLDSPHIVRFVSSGYEAGRYFLAMEHLEGESAWHAMQTRGALPPGEVARIGAGVSRALAALAKKGLVHRDIKPANIMLRRSGEAALVDFGLVKRRTENDLTSPDEFLGTAEYIAPEVIRGAPEDVRTDLYALGVTLWELSADQNPFAGENTMEVLKRVASGRPAPTLEEWGCKVPRELSRLVKELMDPDPRRRLTDPDECAVRFERLAV